VGAQARAGSERTPERERRPATSTKRRVLEVETTEERTLSVGVFKEEVEREGIREECGGLR